MSGEDLLNALIDRREKDEVSKAALETLQCLSAKNINLSLLCQQAAESAREMRDKYEPSRRFRWEDKV